MATVSINDYKLMRARHGRMLAGVAAGLSRASGLDVTLVRLCIGAMVLSGFGVPAYILMWIILPEESPRRGRVIEPAPEQPARIIRIALVGLAALSLLNKFGGFGFANPHARGVGIDGGLGLILLGVGIAILVTRHRPDRNVWSAPTPPPSARPTAPSARPAGDEPYDDEPPTFAGPFSEAMGTVHEALSDAFREVRTTIAESKPRGPVVRVQPEQDDDYYFDDSDSRFDEFGNYNPYAGETMRVTAPVATATVRGDGLSHSGGAALGWARVFGWLVLIWWSLSAVAVSAAWVFGVVSVHAPVVLGVAGWLVFIGVLNTLLHAKFARAIIPALALLLIPIGVAAATVRFTGDVGHEVRSPASLGTHKSYALAAGYLEVDLSHTKIDKPTTIDAKVAAGRLDVTVPNNATVVVHSKARTGASQVFNRVSNGVRPDDTSSTYAGCGDNPPHITLNLDTGAGFVQVQRANGAAHATCSLAA